MTGEYRCLNSCTVGCWKSPEKHNTPHNTHYTPQSTHIFALSITAKWSRWLTDGDVRNEPWSVSTAFNTVRVGHSWLAMVMGRSVWLVMVRVMQSRRSGSDPGISHGLVLLSFSVCCVEFFERCLICCSMNIITYLLCISLNLWTYLHI